MLKKYIPSAYNNDHFTDNYVDSVDAVDDYVGGVIVIVIVVVVVIVKSYLH